MTAAADRIRRTGWKTTTYGASSTEPGTVHTLDRRRLTVTAFTSNPGIPRVAQVEVGSLVLDVDAARALAAILTAALAVVDRGTG